LPGTDMHVLQVLQLSAGDTVVLGITVVEARNFDEVDLRGVAVVVVVVNVPMVVVLDVVVSALVAVVEGATELDVETCFQVAQSGHPPSDISRAGPQLAKASFMPTHPSKLSKELTPITVAARQ